MKELLKRNIIGITLLILSIFIFVNNLYLNIYNLDIILTFLFFVYYFFIKKGGFFHNFISFIFISFTLVPLLIILVLLAGYDIISFAVLEKIILPCYVFNCAFLEIFLNSNIGYKIKSVLKKG